MTILYFVVALGVLVFIHEFGHFIAAKKQGIGVEKFSIGFGPKLFGWTRGETTYMVSLLPFGGYVKLHGEDPEEEGAKGKDSYSARPIWQRSLVVFAGPAMNLVLALVLMPIIFMLGRYEPVFLDQKPVVVGVRKDSPAEKISLKKGDQILSVEGKTFEKWKDLLDYIILHADQSVEMKVGRGEEILTKKVVIGKSLETHAGFLGVEPGYFIGNEPIVDEVSPDSPAQASGFKSGDEILQIDSVPVESWTDMSDKVSASGGKKLALTVRRSGKILTIFLVPRYDEGMKKWLIGVKKDTEKRGNTFIKKKYGFGEAIVHGTQENLKLAGLTLSVLGRLVTANLSYKALGGPIRIAQASAMAARSGLSDFLYFLCFLSIQLGVLNLLPFPVLDGGHLLFFGIETIQKKPVSAKVRGWAEQVGFVLLITLMVLVTLNDVQNLWNISQLLEKFRHIF